MVIATGVDASDTTAVPEAGEASAAADTFDADWLGSNMNVPPAPTVRLVPSGRASDSVTISVPPVTKVPPM